MVLKNASFAQIKFGLSKIVSAFFQYLSMLYIIILNDTP